MTARGIAMTDAIQGPPRWRGPDVLLRQTSFRALAEPRRFRDADGALSTARCACGSERSSRAASPSLPRGADATTRPWPPRIRPGRGATTSPPPTSAWRRPAWPTTTAATHRNPLSTRISCPHRRPGYSGQTSIPTRRRPPARKIGLGLHRRLDGRTDRASHSRPLRALRESRITMTSVQTSQLPTAERPSRQGPRRTAGDRLARRTG